MVINESKNATQVHTFEVIMTENGRHEIFNVRSNTPEEARRYITNNYRVANTLYKSSRFQSA